MTTTTRDAVAATADAILAQCDFLIDAVADDAYTGVSQRLSGGTIGKHVRHSLDHFRALLAVAHGKLPEPIDYDHRDREVPVEHDRAAARAEIARLRLQIAGLGDDAADRPVRVRVMLAGDGAEAELGSTVGRELFFAVHHGIHHHAMIKSIAREFGVSLPGEFGTAPSTIHYERGRSH